MKSSFPILLWACAAVLASARAQAQENADLADLSIEQLMDVNVESVQGASRYDQLVTQAPSSISIVTAEEIRRFGYTSFEDVLRSVRGAFVPDDRNYANLGIRGFHRPGDYTSRVLIMINGHRLNDNLYDSGAIGRDGMLDPELIERVEVIRGPSSSVYGSSAFLAVVNVVTRQGRDINGTELAYNSDSLETQRTRATFGTTLDNGLDLHLSATHYDSAGMDRLYYPEFDQRVSDDVRARHNGVARDMDDEDATKVFGSLRHGGLSVSAYFSDRYKQIPTASFGSMFDEPANWTRDERSYLDVAFKDEFANGLQYNARAFYDRLDYKAALPYDYASPGDEPDRIMWREKSTGEWVGAEMHVAGTLFSRYTFVAGSEYRASLHEMQRMYEDIEPRTYLLDEDTSTDVLGLFTQVEVRLRDDLRLTGGLRYDRYTDSLGSNVSPRMAAIYNPTPHSAVKLLYGEAFRAPNPFERYYYFDEQQLQPALDPETIRTYELVYEHYFGKHYRVNVSAYDYDVHGLITQTDTEEGNIYFANLDAVKAYGVEFEVEAKYGSGLIARTSYAWQRSKDASTGEPLTSSPRHLAKLNLSVPVFNTGMYSNVELQYQSGSLTVADTTSSSFLLTNLGFTTEDLWSHVELSASVHNLFDDDHVYPAGEEHLQDTIKLYGRTYHGKVVVRF